MAQKQLHLASPFGDECFPAHSIGRTVHSSSKVRLTCIWACIHGTVCANHILKQGASIWIGIELNAFLAELERSTGLHESIPRSANEGLPHPAILQDKEGLLGVLVEADGHHRMRFTLCPCKLLMLQSAVSLEALRGSESCYKRYPQLCQISGTLLRRCSSLARHRQEVIFLHFRSGKQKSKCWVTLPSKVCLDGLKRCLVEDALQRVDGRAMFSLIVIIIIPGICCKSSSSRRKADSIGLQAQHSDRSVKFLCTDNTFFASCCTDYKKLSKAPSNVRGSLVLCLAPPVTK